MKRLQFFCKLHSSLKTLGATAFYDLLHAKYTIAIDFAAPGQDNLHKNGMIKSLERTSIRQTVLKAPPIDEQICSELYSTPRSSIPSDVHIEPPNINPGLWAKRGMFMQIIRRINAFSPGIAQCEAIFAKWVLLRLLFQIGLHNFELPTQIHGDPILIKNTVGLRSTQT